MSQWYGVAPVPPSQWYGVAPVRTESAGRRVGCDAANRTKASARISIVLKVRSTQAYRTIVSPRPRRVCEMTAQARQTSHRPRPVKRLCALRRQTLCHTHKKTAGLFSPPFCYSDSPVAQPGKVQLPPPRGFAVRPVDVDPVLLDPEPDDVVDPADPDPDDPTDDRGDPVFVVPLRAAEPVLPLEPRV